jgi:hypothetical protein
MPVSIGLTLARANELVLVDAGSITAFLHYCGLRGSRETAQSRPESARTGLLSAFVFISYPLDSSFQEQVTCGMNGYTLVVVPCFTFPSYSLDTPLQEQVTGWIVGRMSL